ncbi:MAG: type II secretion system F family protein [Gaiellales bacterium]
MLPRTADVVRGFTLALVLVAGAALAGFGVAVMVIVAALGSCGPMLLRRRQRLAAQQRRSIALAARLPDVIDLLAATVDGGVATDTALARLADFIDEPMRAALLSAIGEGGEGGTGGRLSAVDPALRPLGALLQQSEEFGVPVAGSLRLLAADARARARSTARERAAAAAPKMLLVVGALLAPASLLIVIGGQLLVLRDVAGGVLA